ncbi:MAG: hypothetical protein ACOYMV_14000 [Verrucomicrobiia bacterium]
MKYYPVDYDLRLVDAPGKNPVGLITLEGMSDAEAGKIVREFLRARVPDQIRPPSGRLWESASWQAVMRDEVKRFGARTVEAFLHRPRFELYDLADDPNEVTNLAERPDHQELVRSFVEKLKAFQQQTKDPWFHKWTYE